jgi:hypothetical protein
MTSTLPRGLDAVTDQTRIQLSQVRGRTKQDVAGPFAFLDRPVVIEFQAVPLEDHPLNRARLLSNPLQERSPTDPQLPVEPFLGLLHVGHLQEAIVSPQVADPLGIQLPRQPLPAVETDVHREGEPRLQPCMHETDHGILVPAPQFQSLGLGVRSHLVRPTRFDTSQHADQPFSHAVALGDLVSLVLSWFSVIWKNGLAS